MILLQLETVERHLGHKETRRWNRGTVDRVDLAQALYRILACQNFSAVRPRDIANWLSGELISCSGRERDGFRSHTALVYSRRARNTGKITLACRMQPSGRSARIEVAIQGISRFDDKASTVGIRGIANAKCRA